MNGADASLLHLEPEDTFLKSLGADNIAHSGRSLREHLCGVATLLQAWGGDEDLRKAGLFHSIYSTEQFLAATLSLNERQRLAAVIGEPAERLVYLFAVLPRRAVFDYIGLTSSSVPVADIELPSHLDPAKSIPLTQAELIRIAIMHLANRIEQPTKASTGIGFWLSRTSEDIARLRSIVPDLPGPFYAVGRITVEDERRWVSLYLQGVELLLNDDSRGAAVHFEHLCRECKCLGEPFIMLALAGLFGDDSATARSTALKGRELLQGWGVPWHKHLSLGRWLALADLITAHAPTDQIRLILREMRVAHGQAQAALAEEPEDILRDSSISRIARPGASRFLSYLEGVHTQRSERSIRWYPGLSRKAWHDPDRFDVARELALRFADIKAEVQTIPSNYYFEEAEEIGRTGSWKVCMFYEQGRRNRSVSEKCPTITAILDRHSSVQRTAGLVYLSKMAPHTHVAAHHARSNIRLRCHLALNVPDGDCAIRVGDEVRCWDEGQCIVFDDSFEHEVWNRTSGERLVLLVDLWHPDLTTVERDAIDTVNLLGAFKATSMLQNWRRNDLQRTREANPAVK